jgi:hypothetical protein
VRPPTKRGLLGKLSRAFGANESRTTAKKNPHRNPKGDSGHVPIAPIYFAGR